MKATFAKIWSAILEKLAQIFSKKNIQKARELGLMIGDLLEYAMPAVAFVASRASSDSPAAKIVALLKEVNAPEIPAPEKPMTALEKRGLLLNAASLIIKGKIEQAIAQAGAAGIVIAGKTIKSVADIPSSVIDAAAQNAYTIIKNKLSDK